VEQIEARLYEAEYFASNGEVAFVFFSRPLAAKCSQTLKIVSKSWLPIFDPIVGTSKGDAVTASSICS
jgi:hypothetical protein